MAAHNDSGESVIASAVLAAIENCARGHGAASSLDVDLGSSETVRITEPAELD